MCGLQQSDDPNLIAGFEGAEDAGVYRIGPDLALVQTIDFFTPIVDDPYFFGQIAAANALSDVYAMGGKPITAMNVVCFPARTLDIDILREILRGGLVKMSEAGVTLVGGHSVNDPELKYGLSVTGLIHPSKVVTNGGARPGDFLVLTKPIGTGIINTAIKNEKASPETVKKVQMIMTALNKAASEAMVISNANACTDVTGFGLLGHLSEIMKASKVGAIIDINKVPIIEETFEFAKQGFVPGGTRRNKEFRRNMIESKQNISDEMINILFDPQTSGGLLISIPEQNIEALLKELAKREVECTVVIGKVIQEPECKVILQY